MNDYDKYLQINNKIDKILKNKQLYDYIILNNNSFFKNNKTVLDTDKSSYCLYNKNNNCLFSVTLKPNIEDAKEIEIYKISLDSRLHKFIKVEFINKNYIIVTDKQNYNITDKKDKLIRFKSKEEKRIYIDNKEVIKIIKKVETEKQRILQKVISTNVLENGSAITKYMFLGKNSYANTYETKYYKIDEYDVPVFNSRVYIKNLRINGETNISEDEFNDLINYKVKVKTMSNSSK